MNWHKITFNDEQIMHGAVVQLLHEVQSIFENNQKPTDFCVFKEDTFESDKMGYIIYFSPVAFEFCNQSLLAHGAIKCDKPNLTDLFGWVGDKRKCSRYWSIA